MKAVAIVSGGMDSVTLAHMLKASDYGLELISFNYGQRHWKELEFARECAVDLGVPWHYVDLTNVTKLISNSALTNPDIDVPEGHYADDNMKITVVPNRNSIMLNVATGLAVNIGAELVATGVHAGDHAVYPDCRPDFIRATTSAMRIANEGFIYEDFYIYAPFVYKMKQDIVDIGMNLENPVDYTKTWTCYKGLEKHCGVCGTCVERKEAFELAGFDDPTDYDE